MAEPNEVEVLKSSVRRWKRTAIVAWVVVLLLVVGGGIAAWRANNDLAAMDAYFHYAEEHRREAEEAQRATEKELQEAKKRLEEAKLRDALNELRLEHEQALFKATLFEQPDKVKPAGKKE